MKISKSLKIYTHIILAFFLINSLQANTKLLNNVVIHDKPIKINQLRFKDVNLQDVDLTGKRQYHDPKLLGLMVCTLQERCPL